MSNYLSSPKQLFLLRSSLFNLLVIISIGFSTLFLLANSVQFPGGSWHFVSYTHVFTGEMQLVHPQALAVRSSGYPLMIFLTGYNLHESLKPVILAQWIMAIVMPLFVAGLLWKTSRLLAVVCFFFMCLSLVPYLFLKWLHHDQIGLFLNLALVAASALALNAKKYKKTQEDIPNGRNFYRMLDTVKNWMSWEMLLLSAVLVSASLTRPALLLICLPVFLLIFMAKINEWRRTLFWFSLTIAATLTTTSIIDRSTNSSGLSYSGTQIFYNAYVNSSEFGINLETAGPKTKKLFDIVEQGLNKGDARAISDEYFVAHGLNKLVQEKMFLPFLADPASMVGQIKKFPNHDYFEFLCLFVNDNQFLGSALELYLNNPVYFFQIGFRNIYMLFTEPGYMHSRRMVQNYAYQIREGQPKLNDYLGYNNSEQFHYVYPRSITEVRDSGGPNVFSENDWKNHDNYLIRTIFGTSPIFKSTELWLGWVNLLASLSIISFVFIRHLRWAIAINAIVLMYLNSITGFFAEPNYRYFYMALPLLLQQSAFGLAFFFYWPAQKSFLEILLKPAQFVAAKLNLLSYTGIFLRYKITKKIGTIIKRSIDDLGVVKGKVKSQLVHYTQSQILLISVTRVAAWLFLLSIIFSYITFYSII